MASQGSPSDQESSTVELTQTLEPVVRDSNGPPHPGELTPESTKILEREAKKLARRYCERERVKSVAAVAGEIRERGLAYLEGESEAAPETLLKNLRSAGRKGAYDRREARVLQSVVRDARKPPIGHLDDSASHDELYALATKLCQHYGSMRDIRDADDQKGGVLVAALEILGEEGLTDLQLYRTMDRAANKLVNRAYRHRAKHAPVDFEFRPDQALTPDQVAANQEHVDAIHRLLSEHVMPFFQQGHPRYAREIDDYMKERRDAVSRRAMAVWRGAVEEVCKELADTLVDDTECRRLARALVDYIEKGFSPQRFRKVFDMLLSLSADGGTDQPI